MRGQVSKSLHKDEDCVYIAIHPYSESVTVNDKLYASPKVAKKMTGGNIIKITKEMLLWLDKEQNGGK